MMGSCKFMNQKIKCVLSLWVILAWECISPEVIVKGFKMCCISNAVDGTNDGLLWKDREDDGNVRSE
jgi:hypothetical protein